VRFSLGARQTFFPTGRYPLLQLLACGLPLLCARARHTNIPFVVRRRKTHDKHIVCCAFPSGARQKDMFAVRLPTAHDIFFQKNYFVLLFISPLQKHYFVLYILIYTCLDKFTIFDNYVPLK
jgi:hypothetical protein